ncbi:MAG: IS66 family transposase, partial [Mogibacterium sp.]|nr:IS66 family transposase [Mogibacterium sp.]
MALDELLQRKIMMDRLRDLDGRPAPEANSELSERELREMIEFLQGMIRDLQRQLEEANVTNKRNSEQLIKLYDLLEKQQATIEKLQSQLLVSNKMRFGSPSVKGIEKRTSSRGKHDDKDDFDGTTGSLTAAIEDESEIASTKKGKGNSRKGSTYKTLEADTKVFHRSDESQLPEGSVVISRTIRKVLDEICIVVEHDFELLTYRTKDGSMETRYFPMADDKESHIIKQVVPHTHVTARFLSSLAFNCHQLSTPANREMLRMRDLNLKTCRQTLINWLWRGGEQLNLLIPALKSIALEEGANTNCDETWCRVKTAKKYKKHYIWCLCNRAQKTVIFFYDEGSRSRNALKDFLGDSKIKSMQTDGYNVYMYLDKEQELIDIEHICCWAHARHKFKLAYEQGSDERARIFLMLIGELYGMEKAYKAAGLTAKEIKERRNSAETNRVIADLCCRLNDMLNVKETLGDLMLKAVNYLQSFWK